MILENNISKEERPVKKLEKAKKTSRKIRRGADHGDILGCNHYWLLLICFITIHILVLLF